MGYIMDQLAGDFQQGACLYKPTSGIRWISEHLCMSDRPQKQASAKQTHQLLAVVYWYKLRSLLKEPSIR